MIYCKSKDGTTLAVGSVGRVGKGLRAKIESSLKTRDSRKNS